MTIQKKSLISKLNTTKQATAASTPAQDNPNVSAPVLGRRLGHRVGIRGPLKAMKKK